MSTAPAVSMVSAADSKSSRIGSGLVLRVAISTAILGWLGSRVDWGQIAASFRGLRWGWWVSAVGVYLGCQLLCCVRWLWLSRPMGFHQSVARFSGIYFVGMFFNLFLPTSVGGDAVRAVYLANGSGRRMAALLSVLLDRLSGLVVLIGLACLAAALSPVALPTQLTVIVWSVGVSAIVGVLSAPLLTSWFARSTHENKFLTKIRGVAEALDESIRLFRRRPDVLLGTTALSVVVQVLNAVLVWMIGMALRLDIPAAYYGLAAPMVTLATLIPISLNGMGLREGGMVLFLGPAGASTADAVSLAFLWFLVQTTTSLFGAAVYLFGRFEAAETAHGERPAIDRDPAEGRASQYRTAA